MLVLLGAVTASIPATAAETASPVSAGPESIPMPPGLAEADALPSLTALKLNLGSPDCVIVCPAIPALRAAASDLADALEQRAGRRPGILPDTATPGELGAGPVLVLGDITENRLARTLYLTAYDFADLAWPGAGGHVLRTVRDPFGTGAHAIIIAGSDADGAVAAARELAARVPASGLALPYTNVVKLGLYAEETRGWTENLLLPEAPEEVWRRKPLYGSWAFMEKIGKAAVGYLRTGDERYLAAFRREFCFLLTDTVYRNKTEGGRIMLHSLIDALLVPWDLVADHPFFTAEDRKRIDQALLHMARSREGPHQCDEPSVHITSNHGTGRYLDAFFLGRYFQRRYDLPEAAHWLTWAENAFAAQIACGKSLEDNQYHQYEGTFCNTLAYALAAGNTAYVGSVAFRNAARRAIMEYPPGAHSGYLYLASVATGDPTFLALKSEGARHFVRNCAAMDGATLLGEILRPMCVHRHPEPRPDLLGVAVAPIESNWAKSMKVRLNFGGFYCNSVPPAQGFDKLTIREGFGTRDFWLVLDGISGCCHSFQDGNCLVTFNEAGFQWLQRGRTRDAKTVRQQNGVFAAINASIPARIHRYARLLEARELRDGEYLVATGALEGIDPVDWRRHIVRRRGKWTLVVDAVVSSRDGEFYVERWWHPKGDVRSAPDGWLSRQEDSVLHLQNAGVHAARLTEGKSFCEQLRTEAVPGRTAQMAALLQVSDAEQRPLVKVSAAGTGWLVSGAGEDVWITFEEGEARIREGAPGVAAADGRIGLRACPLEPALPDVPLPWRKLRIDDEPSAIVQIDDKLAVGGKTGTVLRSDVDGRKLWQVKVDSEVLSLHFFGDGLLVGEDDGTLSRFGADGERLWERQIPYVHIVYPYHSDHRSRIREITSADMAADGAQEIIVSNGDRRVYAFDAAGEQLWKTPIDYGNYLAMSPGRYRGKFAVWGGSTFPTICGRPMLFAADGTEHRPFIARCYGNSICEPEGQRVNDMLLADLNDDGEHEAVFAVDLSCSQLFACDQQGKTLWEAHMAGPATTVAVAGGPDGATAVLCGTGCGYISAFRAATGEPLWFTFVGKRPRQLWTRGDGTIIAFTAAGELFVLSKQGELLGHHDLSRPVTALLRPGEHRAQATFLALGTADGNVWLLR